MDTNQQDSITEAQVASWLTAKARQLSEESGKHYARLSLSVRVWGEGFDNAPDYLVSAFIYIEPDSVTVERSTVDVAIREAVLESAKDTRAEKLRTKAADLIAQARQLEGVRA